jgi:signal transduction histidine kinase
VYIEVLDMRGRVVAVTTSDDGRQRDSCSAVFRNSPDGFGLGNLYLHEGRLTYDITAPMVNPRPGDTEAVGVVKAAIELNRILDVIGDHTGLGDTGELVLARRSGEHIEFLSPLRHTQDAALKLRLGTSNSAVQTLFSATQRNSGVTPSTDYRGVRTLDAYQHIPISGWGLVAKIDEAEAFAPISHLRAYTIAAVLVALAIGVLAAMFFAAQITAPLRKLRRGTEILATGDLDHRLRVSGADEVADLAASFNTMAERLQEITASRDELNDEIAWRQRTQRELADALKELERSNAELEQFAYVASHELQEPLRKIGAFGELLVKKAGDKLPDDARDCLERMQGAASRMSQLIHDLLSYSRVTTQAQPFVQVDLSQVAHDAVADLQLRIEETGALVDIGRLPSIHADPVQLRQLLQNLIGNALKFSRPGVPPVVRVSGRLISPDDPCRPPGPDANALCRIDVQDNGIGFDAKHAERIFGMFQRLHARGTYDGTGIGLALCQKIVERHGGTISAGGIPGEGATFTVTLPVAHSEGGAETEADQEPDHDSDG